MRGFKHAPSRRCLPTCRLLYNRWRGGDASMRGFKRNQRRSMHVSEVSISEDLSAIGVTNEQASEGCTHWQDVGERPRGTLGLPAG